jgi:hypothetical protein
MGYVDKARCIKPYLEPDLPMTTTASFEPLFPEDRMLDPLVEPTGELVQSSQQLLTTRGTPLALALVPLLRAMNSCYTNKIEGQRTTPAQIEAALKREYAVDAAERRKQPGLPWSSSRYAALLRVRSFRGCRASATFRRGGSCAL